MLRRFEVDSDSCVNSMILNIHWTCLVLVFGVIRQVGAYDA